MVIERGIHYEYVHMTGTYINVFKLWFTLRVSARAEAPDSSILLPSRLCKGTCTPELVQAVNGIVSLELTSVLSVTCYVAALWPELWLQWKSDHCL